jgi:hypothetical protein
VKARPLIPGNLFRWLCLITAVANITGNMGMIVFHEPLFAFLGVPQPVDLYLFTLECVLSFTMGMVALLVFLRPQRAIGLLIIGAVGKGLYGIVTYYFYAIGELHPFFLAFVAWDAVFVMLFLLFWVQLAGPDLLELQQTRFAGIDNPARAGLKRALVIGFSLTGNGSKALQRLELGLKAEGYEVDRVMVETPERLFQFPLSFGGFVRIIVRAFTRRPAKVAPLAVPPGKDWDLVVVESATWLLGMTAPVESMFRDPANRTLFTGRDAAMLVVARGAYQRTMCMGVRWLERAGANVVGARGFTHQGREPRRLMSLWFYLIFKKPGVPRYLAEPAFGLSPQSLDEVGRWGADLATRPRTRKHWTLLVPEGLEVRRADA